MNLQRLLSLSRKAVDDYHMIQSGDRIAVGISGGKDSLTLLCALNGLKRFYPADFELIPICVDLGFSDKDPAAFGELKARAALEKAGVIFLLQAADVAADALVGDALLLGGFLHAFARSDG